MPFTETAIFTACHVTINHRTAYTSFSLETPVNTFSFYYTMFITED
jgi:hypothetical protein